MDNRLIITKKQDCVKTYYFENDKLVTIHAEQTGNSILNNIYIGKVKNIVKNINAAFIEIQKEEKCYISMCIVPILHNEAQLIRQIENQ